MYWRNRMNVVRQFGAFVLVITQCGSPGAMAENDAQRCRAVAAQVAAEISAHAIEPVSEVAMNAAKEGARRGCLAAATTPAAAPRSNAPVVAAVVNDEPSPGQTKAQADGGGFLDFLNRPAVRTDGHKRLKKSCK